MDHEARCPAHLDPADPNAEQHRRPDRRHRRRPEPCGQRPGGHRADRPRLPEVDWLTAQAELDACDGYVVLAVDPQTGEVDAHGPFRGLDALEAAESMRATLDREDLDRRRRPRRALAPGGDGPPRRLSGVPTNDPAPAGCPSAIPSA